MRSMVEGACGRRTNTISSGSSWCRTSCRQHPLRLAALATSPAQRGRNPIFLLLERLIMATRTRRKTTNILGNDTIKSVKVRVV